ncbi:arsenate reductase ArsC [Sedimenticola hydrogenitrophicus]|uniref:arsenate reductase ArsC n=1 Tax=Sedimenticola hydrogenitrophicus TaxID=2967975 RepID=UPI0023B1E97B|nr:arsenate reductase ArsC [Sedimenticola hydrogenitrophicus]
MQPSQGKQHPMQSIIQSPCRILVLCTGNSARSVMAEAIFNHFGGGHFQAFSAGSRPTGKVNPLALERIREQGLSAEDYRSKSWLEFTTEDSRPLDILLTVCDSAAAEVCPAFPGDSVHIHWGLPDPAAVTDDPGHARAAFASCFETLRSRVETLVSLPLQEYGKQELAHAMTRIAARESSAVDLEGIAN